MSEEKRRNDGIIKKFLLNTTRLRPRLTRHKVFAAVLCGAAATAHPRNDEEAALIPLTTGSVAEFYIEPMHECFGDIDVMLHRNTQLAIPRGHSPPTQLPDEFHNYVQVFEIIDCRHFPGYVYSELRYLLTQCSHNNPYNAVEYDTGNYLSYILRFMSMTAPVSGRHTDQRNSYCWKTRLLPLYLVCVVCRGRHKPLIGKHDTETTNGQTQQLLIVLSPTDVN